jgi:hypothetical protein
MWRYLKRDGHDIARSTVQRLMAEMGLRGVLRGGWKVVTTRPDAAASRPPDLVKRDFTSQAPNRLWVVDFTYVATWEGVGFTAFVEDVYAHRLVGWRTTSTMPTELPLDALEMALWVRDRDGHDTTGVIHHSDAGSQGGFNWSSQHLDHGGVWWFVVSRLRIGRSGRSSGLLGIRSSSVMSRWSSGDRSPRACFPRKPLGLPAWRRRSGRVGSTTLAGCPRSISTSSPRAAT